jgi:hypothetical protein
VPPASSLKPRNANDAGGTPVGVEGAKPPAFLWTDSEIACILVGIMVSCGRRNPA